MARGASHPPQRGAARSAVVVRCGVHTRHYAVHVLTCRCCVRCSPATAVGPHCGLRHLFVRRVRGWRRSGFHVCISPRTVAATHALACRWIMGRGGLSSGKRPNRPIVCSTSHTEEEEREEWQIHGSASHLCRCQRSKPRSGGHFHCRPPTVPSGPLSAARLSSRTVLSSALLCVVAVVVSPSLPPSA